MVGLMLESVFRPPKRWNPLVKALVALTVGSFALFGAFVGLISFIENHVSLYATADSPSPGPLPAKAAASLTIGGTTYRVSDVRRSQSSVVVDVELTNATRQPATPKALTLAGGDGATYRTSDDAPRAIQPGATAKLSLVYDLPRSAIGGADLRVGDGAGRIELGL